MIFRWDFSAIYGQNGSIGVIKPNPCKLTSLNPNEKPLLVILNSILSLDRTRPHQGELTVHPAYTWLYPKLIYQMAQVVQTYSPQSLEVVSADYQHEREEYLTKSGAQPVEHTLLMSRSVWHKLKEVKKE